MGREGGTAETGGRTRGMQMKTRSLFRRYPLPAGFRKRPTKCPGNSTVSGTGERRFGGPEGGSPAASQWNSEGPRLPS